MSEIVEVEIEKLVYGGDGLARAEGRVLLLPFVLPGERVLARVTRDSGSFLRAEAEEILTPSPLRQKPECPYFTRCGGCHYQHMSYEGELEQKRAILREALRRIGKIDVAGEIGVVAGEPLHYRNRIQLHAARNRAGYFQADSRRLCAITSCPIASPRLNQAISGLGEILPHSGNAEATIELFTNEAEVQVNAPRPFRALGTTNPIEFDGLRVSRHSFFQVNRFLIRALVDTVLEDSSGRAALDLYAGVGLFSRTLSGRFDSVTAVESSASSHFDSVENAPRSERSWTAVRANVEEFLESQVETPDLIVADPPRTGLGSRVVQQLLRLRAARLTVVSCDPSTLARDLTRLLPAYAIQKITLVDLFPRTAHMETVVQLQALSHFS